MSDYIVSYFIIAVVFIAGVAIIFNMATVINQTTCPKQITAIELGMIDSALPPMYVRMINQQLPVKRPVRS